MLSKDIGIENQIPEDKMYLLRLVAHQYLGAKWQYYTKIKRSGKELNLFKKASLLEQMKATQAALRFTSKAARKAYRAIYQECIRDIRACSEEETKSFPTLPELVEGKNTPTLTPDFDAVIIEWTPLKFFLPCKQIRSKGSATERHTEGLTTKLYFKVIGYYSTDENWDQQKLSFYLRKIGKDSTFQEVSNSLEPLKKDILRFSESYNLFKFGQPILSGGASSEDSAFNDAMGIESPGSQVRTLYWQEFIYRGVELFLFRYYLTLVSATNSPLIIKYLGTLFEPALAKAIENKNIFIGSFDTDLSKRKFRLPYAKFKEQKDKTPLKRRLKTKRGNYITYNYTHPLLDRVEVSFDPSPEVDLDSQWAHFLKQNVLGQRDGKGDKGKVVLLDLSIEDRENLLIQVMNFIIKCNNFRQLARNKIFENFKQRVKNDKELSQKRTREIRRNAEKKIRQMVRKVQKLTRLKQTGSVKAYQLDIEKFKEKVEERCQSIESQTETELSQQKKRLKRFFSEIVKESKQSIGRFPKSILKTVEQLDGEFIPEFKKYVATNIQKKYEKELEPFYTEMFEILGSSPQEKVILIQSLEKSGGSSAIKLELTEEEEAYQKGLIVNLKTKIKETLPDLFEHKVVFMTLTVPIEDLFKIGINNPSLMAVLRLKVMSRKNPRMRVLDNATVRSLTVLNLVMNPVPKYNIVLPGREKDPNPQKSIDSALFNKLIIQIQK